MTLTTDAKTGDAEPPRPVAAVDTSSVPFAITDRAFLAPQRYTDRQFFELENEKLWPHVWQMACRLQEIPKVGDFVEYWVAELLRDRRPHQPDGDQGVPELVPSPRHAAGARMRDVPRWADRLPVPCLALEHRRHPGA